VHESDSLIQGFYFKSAYFQVRLSSFIRSAIVSFVGIVTHVILFIGWISTWFVDGCLIASTVERETVGGNKQAVGAKKGCMERGSSVSFTGSPGWVEKPPSSLSFKRVFVVLGVLFYG
jgi:hypothetical protein